MKKEVKDHTINQYQQIEECSFTCNHWTPTCTYALRLTRTNVDSSIKKCIYEISIFTL